MSSVLITGGSGFLGRALARRFIGMGWRTCLYARNEHAMHAAAEELRRPHGLRCFIGDVRDYARLFRALHGVTHVVHAAALKRVEVGEYDTGELARTNVEGTANVLAACHAAGVERAILVSTDKAVAPTTAYGASKMLAERMFLAAPPPCTHGVVRYGNVAGSTGSVIRRWLADPWRATMTDPECTRYWMDVGDAVDLVFRAIFDVPHPVLLPDDLRAFRLGDLAHAMGITPVLTGLGPGEKLHETLDGITTSETARRMTIDELRQRLEGLR